MGRCKIVLCLVVAAGILTVPMVAFAQQDPALQAQNKLLSKRAAEADAYRKLAETVYGLQINSETYVRDFITESDSIRTDLDTFVRGIRLGEPKWDSELMCTVEAEVTVAKVIEELKSMHSRFYKGDKLKAVDFEQIKQYLKKDVIKAVGHGAPRPELPPDIPGGDIPMPPGITLPDPPIPPLWKAVPANERLMAERAAEVDAKRRLVERIKGLRIDSQTIVRDFVAESDVINTYANAMLVGAHQVGKAYYHPDELIVEVTCEVPVETVITTIKELHKRHYKGNTVKGEDIEQVTRNIKGQTFQATGMGVPRPQVIQQVAAAVQQRMPDWVGETLRAEGKGVPPPDAANTPQGKLMAARAAEVDAKRKLGERAQGLVIEGSTTVRDFIAQHDEINTELNGYLVGSYVRSTTYDPDGTATVTVEMPAMQVWEIVHSYTRITRR